MQIVYGFFMANARVLVSDPLAEEGLEILKKAFDVDVKTDLKEDDFAGSSGIMMPCSCGAARKSTQR